jgi:spermidine synthase
MARPIHRARFSDPRLEVKIGDGFEYVKSTPERFDLIVLDLTDPMLRSACIRKSSSACASAS